MKRFLLAIIMMPLLCSSAFSGVRDDGSCSKVNLGVAFGTSFFEERNINVPNLLCHGFDEVDADYSTWHLEIISDFLLAQERLSLSAGVRLTNRAALVEGDWDDLYWLVDENATTCDYISLNSFGQRNYYVGVPLSFRVFFNDPGYRVRPYARFDASFDFLVSNCNMAEIWSDRMARQYEDRVEDEIGKPENFHTALSAAGGIRIDCKNFFVCPEIVFPRIELGGSPISFIDDEELRCDGGIKVTIQFPIGKTSDVVPVEPTYSSIIQTETEMPSEDF